MILDEDLCNRAILIAKQNLEIGLKGVDNKLEKNKEGKNLGIITKIAENVLTPKELMDEWYKENENYNYIEPENENIFNNCYDFTQMIWKDSEKFGIGFCSLTNEIKNEYNDNNSKEGKKNKNLEISYVALYFPPGNIPGEYKKNVLKKIQKTKEGDSDARDKIKENKKPEKEKIREKGKIDQEPEFFSRNKTREEKTEKVIEEST